MSYDGIEIIDADNRDQSVLSFIRKGKKGDMLVCVFNMAPVERPDFTIGLPVAGVYEEIWNTELEQWGGVWKEHNQTVQTQEGLWKDYKKKLQGKGYTRGFLSINMRATNEYRDRTSVAYIANRYMNPVIKNFFVNHNIDVDEDGFALSEMLQFIWRSAIRDGKEIWIYVPSMRMRNLLKQWINNNSKGE